MISKESIERTKRGWQRQADDNRAQLLKDQIADLDRRVSFLERLLSDELNAAKKQS